MDQAAVGFVVRVAMDAAQAESTAKIAASGFADVLTMTTIVSWLHERRRVLSGLAAKSMFAAAVKSGIVETAIRQNARSARLNKTGERSFCVSA